MCVFDFLSSLPVLVAVAWRFRTEKRRRVEGNFHSRSLSAHRPPRTTKEDWFSLRGVGVCVCAFGFAVSYVRPSVVDFVCFRGWGMDCLCSVSSARSFALSFGSLTLSLAFSSFPTRSDLHLNLITFTRKYYLYYVFCFFLLPLICNNSCILRDATVCVCVFVVVCAAQKREVCPIFPACLRVVCGGCDFYLQ